MHHHDGLLIVVADPWILIGIEHHRDAHSFGSTWAVLLGIECSPDPSLSVINSEAKLPARKVTVSNQGISLSIEGQGIPLAGVVVGVAIQVVCQPNAVAQDGITEPTRRPVP